MTASGDRLAFVRALAAIEGMRTAPASALAAGGAGVRERAARLLGFDERASRPALSRLAAITVLALGALAAGYGARVEAAADPSAPQPAPVSQAAPSVAEPGPLQTALSAPVRQVEPSILSRFVNIPPPLPAFTPSRSEVDATLAAVRRLDFERRPDLDRIAALQAAEHRGRLEASLKDAREAVEAACARLAARPGDRAREAELATRIARLQSLESRVRETDETDRLRNAHDRAMEALETAVDRANKEGLACGVVREAVERGDQTPQALEAARQRLNAAQIEMYDAYDRVHAASLDFYRNDLARYESARSLAGQLGRTEGDVAPPAEPVPPAPRPDNLPILPA